MVGHELLLFSSGVVIGLAAGRFGYHAKLQFYRRFIHERLSELNAIKGTGTWDFSPSCGIEESSLESVELPGDRLAGSAQIHTGSRYKN